MKIQVWVGGDVFVFSGSQLQVQELVKAAVLVVFGETEKRYTLVDSLDLPVSVLHHFQTYRVVQESALPKKPTQRCTAYQAIKPDRYFDDEVGVNLQRTTTSLAALSALREATGLNEDLIETLFIGCESIRVHRDQISRREVYIDLSGRFCWGFGEKCLGKGLISELRIEETCIWLGSIAFQLMIPSDAQVWRLALTLDLPGFTYFLRSFERCSILKRWSA